MNEILGKSIPDSGIGSGGIGWVVIPSEINREQYIRDCYRTHTLTINAGIGCGFFNNIPVAENVIQNIEFPDDKNNRGSAVVWIKDSVTNLPVVIAEIRRQNDYYNLDENQIFIKRSTKDNTKSIKILADGNSPTLFIDVSSKSDNPSKINIKLTSKNKNSVLNLDCDNQINITSAQEINAISESKISMKIKKEGEIKTELSYTAGEGLNYQDEFGNKIICEDNKVNIVSKNIIHNEGSESMVLGDTLSKLLSQLISEIQKITVKVSGTISSVPLNVAMLKAIASKIESIKSSKSNLD